jgi:DNA modification methylase
MGCGNFRTPQGTSATRSGQGRDDFFQILKHEVNVTLCFRRESRLICVVRYIHPTGCLARLYAARITQLSRKGGDTLANDLINRIICGDNVEIMRSMDANSVDLTVTSPPYDNLRTYNGYSFDFESVAQELYRITKPGGVVVWVVGDATVRGSETLTSFRQALYFRDIGFNVHDTMIYMKENWVPLTHKRYEQQFEYMFIFVKGRLDTFIPIKMPCIRAGGNASSTYRQDATGVLKPANSRHVVHDNKTRGNVWSYQVGNNKTTKDKIAFDHPAVFPEALAQDHIASWSNPGDIVFDPFGGSGTTAKMALANGRRFIHVDISEEYCEIARKRIELIT